MLTVLLAPRLRVNGVTLLLPMFVLVACTGGEKITLFYPIEAWKKTNYVYVYWTVHHLDS